MDAPSFFVKFLHVISAAIVANVIVMPAAQADVVYYLNNPGNGTDIPVTVGNPQIWTFTTGDAGMLLGGANLFIKQSLNTDYDPDHQITLSLYYGPDTYGSNMTNVTYMAPQICSVQGVTDPCMSYGSVPFYWGAGYDNFGYFDPTNEWVYPLDPDTTYTLALTTSADDDGDNAFLIKQPEIVSFQTDATHPYFAPEPASAALFGMALASIAAFRRRRPRG